ncbi:MAG: GyrI-like domain-containing protein [Cyanobacteria bacterium P01_A01_bin.17]
MLSLKKAQIEQTLQTEAARLRAVESRLQQIERRGQFQDDDVVLKSLSATPFLSLRRIYPDLAQTFAAISEMGQAVNKQIDSKFIGHFAAVIYGELYEEANWDLEFGFLLTQTLDITVPLSNGSSMDVRELPPVETAVTAVRFGGPEKGHLSYSAIGTWAEIHQYKLIGPGREIFIVPPKPGYESEMVVEIQFPVEAIAA